LRLPPRHDATLNAPDSLVLGGMNLARSRNSSFQLDNGTLQV
jgi:hypothetical protein